MREATWAQIGMDGIGQHFTRTHVNLAAFHEKDTADTCRFGNSFFSSFFCKCNENNWLQQFLDVRKYNFYFRILIKRVLN